MINEPDGFTGAILASGSVKGLKTLINGPGGCRSRAMNFLRETMIEFRGEDECACRSRFMGRSSMLPCTHLNADDIILGSSAKIAEGIRSVVSSTGAPVVLVDTLGATIQVVDREQAVQDSGYGDKVILAEEDLSGMTFTEGFDDTMVRILRHYVRKGYGGPRGGVNVLGYTQADRGWDYGKDEIRKMLALLGLDVSAFIGCDCSPEELERSAGADLNILIHPEMSVCTAEWYQKEFGIPYLAPSSGTPLGYDSIRSFLKEVASALDVDPSEALAETDRREDRTCRILQNYDKFAGSLRGHSMTINGLSSDILPISRLMYDYFNVVPRSVRIRGANRHMDDDRVYGFLSEIGHSGSLGAKPLGIGTRVFMTDGLTATDYGYRDPQMICIGIMMPYQDTVPLADRCLVGFSGTVNLLDQVMNGLRRFTCGQPTPADFR